MQRQCNHSPMGSASSEEPSYAKPFNSKRPDKSDVGQPRQRCQENPLAKCRILGSLTRSQPTKRGPNGTSISVEQETLVVIIYIVSAFASSSCQMQEESLEANQVLVTVMSRTSWTRQIGDAAQLSFQFVQERADQGQSGKQPGVSSTHDIHKSSKKSKFNAEVR